MNCTFAHILDVRRKDKIREKQIEKVFHAWLCLISTKCASGVNLARNFQYISSSLPVSLVKAVLTFQATLKNLYAYFINHRLAVLCKVLGDFWGGDIFS